MLTVKVNIVIRNRNMINYNEITLKEKILKKIFIALLVALTLLVFVVSPAFAGGDQVRGEKGQGTVNQEQVQDPPPFQP